MHNNEFEKFSIDEKLNLLLNRGITRTRFVTVILDRNALQGIPIGQGKCKAVILKANYFITGTAGNPQSTSPAAHFYYGDSHQQSYEYLIALNDPVTGSSYPNNNSSEIIFCHDLQDVWVKFPQDADETASIEVDIIIYD